MRVLVTGGSGFIGTNLVDRFVARGDSVVNLDILRPRNGAHRQFWQEVDLRDEAALVRAVGDFSPEIVLHMGARTDLDGRSLADYAANTVGVVNLIDAMEGLPVLRRVIFASSRLVCRIGYEPKGEEDYCPTTPYGESKVVGERLVRENAARIGAVWTIVRPTSIWGPWFDIPYKTFFLTIARGHYVHPGKISILKSFGYIGNTIFEIERLLDAEAPRIQEATLYLADYPPTDVAVMAEKIRRELGVAPLRHVDRRLLRVFARAGDALKALGWHNPPLTSFRLANLLTPMVHDLELLHDIAGELPYKLDEGVRQTVAWLRARGEVP